MIVIDGFLYKLMILCLVHALSSIVEVHDWSTHRNLLEDISYRFRGEGLISHWLQTSDERAARGEIIILRMIC